MKKPKELQSQFVTWKGDRLMLENEWQQRDWVWFSNLLHEEQEAVGPGMDRFVWGRLSGDKTLGTRREIMLSFNLNCVVSYLRDEVESSL